MKQAGDDIKVSVYVITYNQERYIAQCLEGIVSQKTDFAIEAIVIDDGSTDGTPAIVSEYARRYPQIIRPVTTPHNRYRLGESKFLLDFLPIARGKYLASCEGDDFWTYPGKLQRQADFLDSHPDYTAHTHRHRILNETGLTGNATVSICTTPDSDTDPAALLMCHYHENTLMIRSDNVRADKSLERLLRYEAEIPGDVKIFAHTAQGKCYSSNDIWSVYRLNPGGVFVSERIKLAEKAPQALRQRHMAMLEKLKEYYPEIFSHNHRNIRMYAHTASASQYLAEGKVILAAYHKLSAFIASPCAFVRLYINKLKSLRKS